MEQRVATTHSPWALFLGGDYYPEGGMLDFHSFHVGLHSVESALLKSEADWGHAYNAIDGAIVHYRKREQRHPISFTGLWPPPTEWWEREVANGPNERLDARTSDGGA